MPKFRTYTNAAKFARKQKGTQQIEQIFGSSMWKVKTIK